MSRQVLPRVLLERAFSAKEAKREGLTFYDLRKMIQGGTVEKIARGVYRSVRADYSEEQDFAAASTRIGHPNAVCLLSALVYYKLTDAIPKKTWLMVESSKRTKSRDIRLLRTRNPRWNVGIVKTNDYWITSLERTLIDTILYRQLVGTNVAMEALRQAVKKDPAMLGKMMNLGKKLGVSHRILPYIEALA